MKDHPILFSTPMVQAILNSSKTMTRRIMKPQPAFSHGMQKWVLYPKQHPTVYADLIVAPKYCPYGQVGDVLWVRELHYRYGHWQKNGFTKRGKQKYFFVPDKHFTDVRYYDNPPAVIEKNTYRKTGWYKRLARFMPKAYCRTLLKITDIRVERLQDITEVDAVREGVELNGHYKHYFTGGFALPTAKMSFGTLWQKINGLDSWEANPWVWVVSFERIEKPI